MPVSAYLYPWDVDGDPAAPDRIAGLGVTEVSLAAAYHAVRAVTPPVNVKLIDGINHMGIVSNPAAVSIIADEVAKSGANS